MPDRGVGVTDQASAAGVAEVRARERTIGATTYAEQYVIPISERVASFKGYSGSFRIPGRAALTQNLVSIGNTTGSTVLLGIRRATVQVDTAGILNTSWANVITSSRITTAPTGGAALTKVAHDTGQTSATNVTLLCDASADGTSAATALTATPGAAVARQFASRLHTAAGQYLVPDESLLPRLTVDDPFLLRAGEFLLVSLIANATAANGTAAMYFVNLAWEEFTLP